MALAPAKFLAEVRAEAGRVTWPGRKETLVTTGLVLAMAVMTALFFFTVDVVVGWVVAKLFLGAS